MSGDLVAERSRRLVATVTGGGERSYASSRDGVPSSRAHRALLERRAAGGSPLGPTRRRRRGGGTSWRARANRRWIAAGVALLCAGYLLKMSLGYALVTSVDATPRGGARGRASDDDARARPDARDVGVGTRSSANANANAASTTTTPRPPPPRDGGRAHEGERVDDRDANLRKIEEQITRSAEALASLRSKLDGLEGTTSTFRANDADEKKEEDAANWGLHVKGRERRIRLPTDAATRDDLDERGGDWPTEATEATEATTTAANANANANANAREKFDAVDPWLTIGIPTAPRANDVDYLTATIDALLAELPDDDDSAHFGKTRVVVMNAAGAGTGNSHRAFEKVRDAVVALASRATESAPPPGARAALHATFFDAPLDAHPDPTPDARDPDDLHNPTSTPGRAVRKQTSDVVSLLDAVVGGGGGGGGGDDASVPPLVPPSPLFMFMEDDFRTCEGALRGLRYLVQKTRTVYPEWLGLRTSYGLNGVVVRSEDLPGFRDYLLRHQARLPPDLLWTEWVEGTRADVRERTNARKLIVYRYNLFEHLGAVSTFSIRPRRPSWPGCYAPMSSAWSLTAVEKFDERRCAKIGDLFPCTGDVDMGKWTGKTPKLPWVKVGSTAALNY